MDADGKHLRGVTHAKFNNYLIYKYTFWHALEQRSLYAPAPENHFDVNHYGSIFSLIIAPFAVIPSLWV